VVVPFAVGQYTAAVCVELPNPFVCNIARAKRSVSQQLNTAASVQAHGAVTDLGSCTACVVSTSPKGAWLAPASLLAVSPVVVRWSYAGSVLRAANLGDSGFQVCV
jgi:hypothetical protein